MESELQIAQQLGKYFLKVMRFTRYVCIVTFMVTNIQHSISCLKKLTLYICFYFVAADIKKKQITQLHFCKVPKNDQNLTELVQSIFFVFLRSLCLNRNRLYGLVSNSTNNPNWRYYTLSVLYTSMKLSYLSILVKFYV